MSTASEPHESQRPWRSRLIGTRQSAHHHLRSIQVNPKIRFVFDMTPWWERVRGNAIGAKSLFQGKNVSTKVLQLALSASGQFYACLNESIAAACGRCSVETNRRERRSTYDVYLCLDRLITQDRRYGHLAGSHGGDARRIQRIQIRHCEIADHPGCVVDRMALLVD